MKTYVAMAKAIFYCKCYVDAENEEEAKQKILDEEYDDMVDTEFIEFTGKFGSIVDVSYDV